MFDWSALGISNVRTLVDVGAAEGAFLVEAIHTFPEITKWVAIEMLPERAEAMLLRVKTGGGRGTFHMCAVGDAPGMMPMLRTGSPNASSLLPCNPKTAEWRNWPTALMQSHDIGMTMVATLDDLCGDIPQVDLMKIDIQGYEARAIRGGQDTLKRTRHLLIEIIHCDHYAGQSGPREIDNLLDGLGFTLAGTYNREYSVTGDLLQVDGHYRNTRWS